MIGWIKKLFGINLGGRLSSVVIYNVDHTTRYMTTPAMDDLSKRKFLKHLFKRYDAKFIEIDGIAHYAKGSHVRSL